MGWSLKRAVIRDRVLRRAVTRGVTAYRRGMADPKVPNTAEREPEVSQGVLAYVVAAIFLLLVLSWIIK